MPSLIDLPPVASISHIPLMQAGGHVATSSSSTNPTPLVVPSSGLMSQTPYPPPPGPQPAGNSLGLTLAPALGLIPQKLVEKVRSGAYVEMREFLRDNILLLEQLETLQGTMPQLASMPGAARPRLREVTTPLAWVYCFLSYMGTSTSDPTTRSQAAYASLLLREAQQHGGRGWLEYDKAFRRQAADIPSLPWDMIHQGIQASTMLNQGLYCTSCQQTDHLAHQCAMSFFQPPSSLGPPLATYSRSSRERPRPGQSSGYRQEFALNICISWNKGQCRYPNSCAYRHICASCQAKHRAKDCPVTPSSVYKRQVGGTGRQEIQRSV